MWKNYLIYLLGISSLFFYSCDSQKEELTFASLQFKDTVMLEGKILNNTFIMGTGQDINYYKTTLLVNAYKGTEEEAIHLFNIADGAHIKSILPKGRGPGEIRVSYDLDVNTQTGEALSYDFMGHNLCHFNIDSVLHYENHREYISCQNYPIYMYAVYEGKNGYLAKGGLKLPTKEIPRFSIIHKDSVIFRYCSFPEVSVPGVPDGIAISYTDRCHVGISPDKTKLICASCYGAILEIFDIYEDTLVLNTIKGFYRPIFNIDKNNIIKEISGKTIYGFRDLYVTDNYIYTIFNDMPDASEQKDIAVFDMKGNAVRLYQGNQTLHKICVDEEKQKIYAVGNNEEHETILLEFNVN